MSTSKHVQYDEIKYNVVFKDMPFAQMYKKVLTAEGGGGGGGEGRSGLQLADKHSELVQLVIN